MHYNISNNLLNKNILLILNFKFRYPENETSHNFYNKFQIYCFRISDIYSINGLKK